MIQRTAGLLCFMLVVCACGQDMIKLNVLELYNRVPAPPASVAEAFARHECKEENMALRCNAEKIYKAIEEEQRMLGEQFAKLNLVLNAPMPGAMQQMDAEAIQKKLATMSDAEKIQFAMAMSQQMGFGAKALTPESEAVIAAQEEHANLSARVASDGQNYGVRYQQETELKLTRERKHKEVETWFETEHKKIPMVVFGEAGRFPEPKAEYALKQAALDRHFAVENEYLQGLSAHWPKEMAYLQELFGPFQEKLAAINYGEDAENLETKRLLVGGQILMLGSVEALVKLSRTATEEAAQWWLYKLELAKVKPQ